MNTARPKHNLHVDFCQTAVVFERFYGEKTEREFVEASPSGTCWLCEQQPPTVSFRKEAHVVPQSLGNKGWLTHDECDGCNELVGRHESALVASLAPYRLTSQFKRGRPKFKDPKSGSFLLSVDEAGNLFVSESAPTGGLAEMKSTNEIHLRIPVDGHRPLSICKVLARLALLLVPELRSTHDHLRKWILGQRLLPDQPLVCGDTRAGEVFAPGLRILERVGSEGKDVAVALTYGGAIYWYVLPRDGEVVSSLFVDRPMIDELLDLSWKVHILGEQSVVAAHHATVTMFSEST